MSQRFPLLRPPVETARKNAQVARGVTLADIGFLAALALSCGLALI
jgi:hypothetical protein